MTERTSGRARPRTRRIAAVAIAVGIAAATAVALPMAASASPAADGATGGFASAKDAAIGPGVELATPIPGTDLAEFCTADFIFSGGSAGSKGGSKDEGSKGGSKGGKGSTGGDVYIGTAAHCVADISAGGPGEDADGCQAKNFPNGTDVIVSGRDGKKYTAKVAYSSWQAMQDNGVTDETNPDLCHFNDFALLKLAPEDVAVTNPSVPNFGGPVGLDGNGTKAGDRVFSYQPNILKPTPNKQGFSLGQPMGPLTHLVATMPPGVSGDSGSGYLQGDGQAFGVLSTQFIGEDGMPLGLNGVTDLAKALDYANTEGGLGNVGLVNGTEPFTGRVPFMTSLPKTMPTMPDVSKIKARVH